MKKTKKFLLMLAVIFTATLALAGCGTSAPTQLATPIASVYLNNGHIVVSTTDNPNAEYYVYGIYSGPYSTNLSLYYEITSTNNYLDANAYVTESANYYFYVRLLGNGEKHLDSATSPIVSYNNSEALESPILERDEMMLSWTSVLNSNGYKIYKNNVYIVTTHDTTYDISGQINNQVVYNFEVQAIGSSILGTVYADSLKSNVISYTDHLILTAPANLEVLTNELDEPYLTWGAVTNAYGYTVLVDNTDEHIVSTNEIVLSDILDTAKQYSIKVKANPTGISIASAYSNNFVYDNYHTLTTPTIIGASRNGSDVVVVWEPVANAESYTLLVNGQVLKDISNNPIIIYDSEVLIGGELEKLEGGFDFEVYANAYDYYLQSATSDLFNYGGIDELAMPENLSVVYDSLAGTAMLSWDAVVGASSYLVALGNETTEAIYNSLEIQTLLTEDEIIQLKVKALGTGYVTDSVYSAPYMFNFTTNYAPGYVDQYFYYYDYYDYCINSQEELNALFGYAINYHIEEFTAYVDYSLTEREKEVADGKIIRLLVDIDLELIGGGYINVDAGDIIILTYGNYIEKDEVISEITSLSVNELMSSGIEKAYLNQGNLNGATTSSEIIVYKQSIALASYTETHSLSYIPPTLNGVSGKEYEFSITYPYGINPTIASDAPNMYVQDTNFAPFSSSIGREANYNDFAPEQSLIEAPVYNSENLFMVVNSGSKPLFMTEDSQAELVYESAKIILRQIIDDNMTDYEKMLAIFDYVNYSTIYDRYVYSLAVGGGEGEGLLPEYKVFYLEGVILDGVAVCDGIAKTIAFLANMEGIEAIKINGTAGTISNTVGHAWNKVYLEIDGVSDWYIIDATLGVSDGAEAYTDANLNDAYDEGEDYVDSNSNGLYDYGSEFLTHDYFLIRDEDVADSHFPTSTFNPVADTYFDYYDFSEYATGYDYYITNQTELNHLVEFLLLNEREGIEIYVDPSFNLGLVTKIQIAINNSGMSGVDKDAFGHTSRTSDRSITMIDFIYP
ncbi:MAG: hypothetical protein PHC46_01220 [Clostridia bacterium]|nr:hypothetical protein [Clostridia bacterium]